MNNTALKIPEVEEDRMTVVLGGGLPIKSKYLLIGSAIIFLLLILGIYGKLSS